MAFITETRKVSGFDEVSLQGFGELLVEQDDAAEASLTIDAEEDLMPRIGSEVRGGRLILGFHMAWYEWMRWIFSGAFFRHGTVRFHLRTPRLRGLAIAGSGSIRAGALAAESCRLHISGSGRITVEALEARSVDASISGSGDITCGGTASRMHAEITGSGALRAERLAAHSVQAGISGSGGITVSASDTLDVRITGSGSVRYTGTPRLSTTITGSGRLIHAGG